MSNLKKLTATTALALILPLAASTASFAQRGGGAVGGGGGAVGGGGHAGGGMGGGMGGGHLGGGGMGGGGHVGGMGGGAAFAGGRGPGPGAGASFSAPRAVGGGASFAATRGGMAAGPSVATAAGPRGNWNGGGGWNGAGGWRGGHHRHGGFWPGVAAGAFVGGALANSYAYYDDPYYYGAYGPDYYADNSYYYDDSAPAVAVGVGGDASYCAQRYRSYDPASGTYLGYDGERHPCP
jgi:hypothetical protein